MLLGFLDKCQDEFTIQTNNITHLNATIHLYQTMNEMLKAEESKCDYSLTLCRKRDPVTQKHINKLLSLHSLTEKHNTDCLNERRELTQNLSSCIQYGILKNKEVHNLTNR